MEIKDILHLASLSRIRVSETEAEALRSDIDSVLSYVSTVNEITADTGITKKPGAVKNVFREDVVTNAAGEYTEDLLREAPQVKNGYLRVKKILSQD